MVSELTGFIEVMFNIIHTFIKVAGIYIYIGYLVKSYNNMQWLRLKAAIRGRTNKSRERVRSISLANSAYLWMYFKPIAWNCY